MQLVMLKESLAALPPLALPAGYSLRHFRPGDEGHWERVLDQSFGATNPPRRFVNVMGRDAACSPERVLFVTWDGAPVATASAWYRPEWGVETGYVHYVGASPAHKGRRLGFQISLAVLHRFVCEGRTRAVLETDDFRVPAIKTYLELGFQPWLVEADQRQRWRTIVETNGLQALCPALEGIVSGPIHEKPLPKR